MSQIRSSLRRSQPVWEEAAAFVELLEGRRLLSVTVTTLASFNGSDGSGPIGGLTLWGDKLYGETRYGGPNYSGTIFSIAVTGGTPTEMASFGGSLAGSPYGGLRTSGNMLYGTATYAAWEGDDGYVFSLPATGGTPSSVADMGDRGGNDAKPLIVNGTLYDAIYGSGGAGAVISTPLAGPANATFLANFGQSDGVSPDSGLVSSGNMLYGTTDTGGPSNDGVLFAIPITGGTPTVLGSFNGGNGANPQGSLILSGNTLYGTTSSGGDNNDGTVFSLSITGGTPNVLASFDGSDGMNPSDGVTLSGNTLFGTAPIPGPYSDAGVLFSVPITGGTPTIVASLDSGVPVGGLTLSGSTFYGTTFDGGAAADGTVFEISGAVATPNIAVTASSSQTATAAKAASLSLGSFSETNGTAPYIDTINWGDGSPSTVLNLPSAGILPATTHTFPATGTFTVFQSITDFVSDVSNTAKFNVVVSPLSLPASKLVVAASPASATAGKTLSSIVVDIESSAGQVVTTNASTVTLSVSSGPSGAKLAGTMTVTANKGIATFSNLFLDTAGKYVLKVTDGSLVSSNTSSFTVAPAVASKVVFGQTPRTSIAGKAISPSVTVKVEDAFGNLETGDKSTVKLVIATGPGGSVLGGSSSVAASGGATFSNLQLNVAGTYSLRATDGTLAYASTPAFSVTPATGVKLVFSTVPSKVVHNTAFTVSVSIEDTFGNLVTTNTTKVTIAIASGPSGGALSGATSVSAVAGVAIFSTLKSSKTGKYTLKVFDGSLTAKVSAIITVS